MAEPTEAEIACAKRLLGGVELWGGIQCMSVVAMAGAIADAHTEEREALANWQRQVLELQECLDKMRTAVRELVKGSEGCVEAGPDGYLICLLCGAETDTAELKHGKGCGVPRVEALLGKD